MQLASEIEQIEPRFAPSPWPGHEHVRGLAVMAPPLSSGHVLGLRVWPENDFAPHVSVWHRAPWGNWSMFSDGPLLEATCQRYWGSAVRESRLARVHLSWTGPNELRVEMEDPNAARGSLPPWSWKLVPLLRMPAALVGVLVGLVAGTVTERSRKRASRGCG